MLEAASFFFFNKVHKIKQWINKTEQTQESQESLTTDNPALVHSVHKAQTPMYRLLYSVAYWCSQHYTHTLIHFATQLYLKSAFVLTANFFKQSQHWSTICNFTLSLAFRRQAKRNVFCWYNHNAMQTDRGKYRKNVVNPNIIRGNCWCKQQWESSPKETKSKYDTWTALLDGRYSYT